MISKIGFILTAFFSLFLAEGCAGKPAQEKTELVISAASSMEDALQDIKKNYEKMHPDMHITYHLGSSGKIARQIEQGAPSDVFVSASQSDMDNLQKKNLIMADTRSNIAENRLALIANKDSALAVASFKELTEGEWEHLAIGEPDTVPAGRYAKQLLTGLGLWDALQAKLVLAKDVRQVLTYVESGNVELGIVYGSDAQISSGIKVIEVVASDWHQAIVYPAAVIAGSAHQEQAETFIQYLTSQEAKNILKKYGFHS